MPRKNAKARSPRIRRTAEDARTAILDAAEEQLIASGPSGIRLQEVARRVGISHPTVLHHFGTREALVAAVCRRSFEGVNAKVIAAFAQSAGGETSLAELLDNVYATLLEGGRARVLTWLALAGIQPGHGDVHLSDVVTAAQALAVRQRGADNAPSRVEIAYSVALTTLALCAQALMGGEIFEDAGLGGDERAGRMFRAWLARVLVSHFQIERERAPVAKTPRAKLKVRG